MPTVYSPPVNTYIPLAEITLASATSSVTLTGFSQDYRDLVAIVEATGSTNDNFGLRLNGDTAGVYTYVHMYGNGSSNASAVDTGRTSLYVGQATDGRSTTIVNLMDYSASDRHSTVLSRWNQASGTYAGTGSYAARWANTAAVTSLTFVHFSGNFAIGSSFKLFGIEA